MKVAINKCYGGFSVSDAAIRRYAKVKGLTLYPETDPNLGFITYWTCPAEDRTELLEGDAWYKASQEERIASNRFCQEHTVSERNFLRDDPVLIQVIEELGDDANGRCAELAVVEIPDDVQWTIEEYDGREWVAEQHRTWS